MSNYTTASLRQLSNEALYTLTEDVQYRIGSHIAGENPTEEYVERQRNLLNNIQDEFKRRSEENDK